MGFAKFWEVWQNIPKKIGAKYFFEWEHLFEGITSLD